MNGSRHESGPAEETVVTPPATGVWQLAWPTMALFALHSLVGVVDFMFVSSLGTEAIAGVGIALQIHFFSFAVLTAVTTGTMAIVSRECGAGNMEEAARATHCSVALSVVGGILIMAVIPWSEPIVAVLQVEPEVAALGGTCLAILLLFQIPFAIEITLAQALRAAGDVRTPLIVGSLTVLLNVVLDYALIFGELGAPELGAEGSAWATGFVFLFAATVMAALWQRDKLILPMLGWRASMTRALSWRLLRIGLPTAVEQAIFSGGLLIFMGIVSSFSTAAISAYLIGVRILSFCFVPGMGFSMAASTLVGQNLGAGLPKVAERLGWRSAINAVAVMGGLGLVIIVFARPLANVFGAVGQETIDLTVSFIWILGAAQPAMAVEFALGGGLRGAGDTRFPLVVVLTGLLVFRLGLAVVVAKPLFGTVEAVWCCLLADWSVKAVLLSWRFASGRWKRIEV